MIIGIAGYAGAGKDTLFSLLQHRFGANYKRYAFADALKAEIRQDLLDNTGIDILTASREEKISVREHLVSLGALRRSQDVNYWVNQVNLLIDSDKQNNPDLIPVITDVRYENEADWLLNKGGVVIQLNRFGLEAANPEEEEFTKPLLERVGANLIPVFWSDIPDYTERDINVLLDFLHEKIFQH